MAAQLQNVLFQLKFTAKNLDRQATKAGKEEAKAKRDVETAIKKGNNQVARIHAQNAIRKQQEKLNLMQLSSRIDAVAGRVQTAITMNTLSASMQKVVRGMDIAMKSMNPEKMTAVMDGFEKSFNDLDVVDEYTREATSSATAVGTPQDDVDRLMNQTADKVGVELTQDLEDATPANTKLAAPEHDENALGDRLRALRN